MSTCIPKKQMWRKLPGLDSMVSFGRSSSQSVMSSCLCAMLRKCFPPFTFHVPIAILALEGTVYSGCSSISDLRMSGWAAIHANKYDALKARNLKLNLARIPHLHLTVTASKMFKRGKIQKSCSQCKLEVHNSALALSESSPLSVFPSSKMSIASCLLLSMKLFCIVLVADRAASPAWNQNTAMKTGANTEPANQNASTGTKCVNLSLCDVVRPVVCPWQDTQRTPQQKQRRTHRNKLNMKRLGGHSILPLCGQPGSPRDTRSTSIGRLVQLWTAISFVLNHPQLSSSKVKSANLPF